MLRTLLFALLAAVMLAGPAGADEAHRGGVLLKREILALYDGRLEGGSEATRLHRFAELPLNHLGYILTYRDVGGELPAPAELAGYGAIVTWFVGDTPNGDAYLAWAAEAARAGLRLVILGELGATVTARNLALANRVLAPAGVSHAGEIVSPADGSRPLRLDPRLIEHECRLNPVPADYPIIEAIGPQTTVGLSVAVPAHIGARTSTLVAIGPRGGYAAFNYEFCHQRAPLHRGRWLIDPFAFYSAALGAGIYPVPDTTTLSGRRIYFSLVYGDGWAAPVDEDRSRQSPRIAAEIVVRELLQPFGELPVTLDLRPHDIDRQGRYSSRARTLADEALALPHVARPGRRPVAARLARFDASHPSVSSLTPLAVGEPARVALAASSDERAYRTDAAATSMAFHALRETLAHSELPRRLKPANINFHAGAGADRALVNVLKRHLAEARAATLAPITAGHYADIVHGFFTTRIETIGANAWSISERGQLQTVRFDDIADLDVDYHASRGVIGARRHGDALYVALDAQVESAVVTLAAPRWRPHRAGDMALIESRWRLAGLRRGGDRLVFAADGFGAGEMSWWAPPGLRLRALARRGGEVLWSADVVTAADGRLRLTIPVPAMQPLTIELAEVAP